MKASTSTRVTALALTSGSERAGRGRRHNGGRRALPLAQGLAGMAMLVSFAPSCAWRTPADRAAQTPAVADPNGPRLAVSFDREGCRSIAFNQVELLATGTLAVGKATLTKSDGTTYVDGSASRATFGDPNVSARVTTTDATATSAWGSVQCRYTAQGNRLDLRITVANTSADTLTELTLSPLELKLPAEPKVARLYVDFFGRLYAPRSHHNLGAPTILPADFGSGLVVLCNDDPVAPLTLSWEGRDGAARVSVRAGGDQMPFDEVYVRRPIAPGASDTYTISLRFAPGGANPLDVADDVCKAYAKAFPRTLAWPDRRPITRMFFGPGLPKEQVLANCRDPQNAKLPTAPDPQFHKNMTAKFRGAIAVAQATGAQGIIMWSLEGETFPHATTYIGDPRCMKWLNPEMDLVADEMIGLIRAADLRPGVCLRPSRVIYARNDDPALDTVKHSYADAVDPFLELDAKIQYCKDRWKVSLFYVDTNIFWRPRGKDAKWTEGHISADTWRRLNQKHPDVLLIPELGYTQLYAHTVPYSELDMGARETPEMIRRIWPEACSILQLEDDDPIADHDILVKLARTGDIIMANSGVGRYSVGISEARREAAMLDRGAPTVVREAGADLAKLLAAASDADPATRFHAAAALATHRDPAAATRLVAMLADEQWVVRKAAVVALGQQGDTNAVAPLVKVMADPKGHMDWIAARALGAIGPASVPALIAAIKADPRRAAPAIAVLGDLAAADAVEPLAVLADDPKSDWQARIQTMGALGKIGSEAAVAALIRTLQSTQSEGIRQAAARALGTVTDARAAPALQDALDSEMKTGKPSRDLLNSITGAINALKRARP